jgi:asparagine synthase (glutamine-hydrolysing)
MGAHIKAARQLLQRIQDYLAQSLQPLCDDLAHLYDAFREMPADTSPRYADILDAETLRPRIVQQFATANEEQHISQNFLRALCRESLRYDPTTERDSAAFSYPTEGRPAVWALMKETLDSDHHWTVLGPDDLVNVLEESTIARDLPGMADVDFSLLAFCKEIRNHVKVALSGECADEIFGGYPWYRDPQVRALSGFPWSQNAELRSTLLCDGAGRRISALDYIHDRYRDTCAQSDILPGTSAQERRMKEMVNLNFRWFMQTLLDRKDRMSMFSGLEVRVPFCDYRIAEYLYGVPWEFKDYQGKEKGLLRTALADMLPQEVLWRKKSPYPKTFDPRYTKLVTERLELLLEDVHAPLFHLVDRGTVRAMIEKEEPWPWYGQLMKGPQTIAYLLQIDFWLRHYQVELLF